MNLRLAIRKPLPWAKEPRYLSQWGHTALWGSKVSDSVAKLIRLFQRVAGCSNQKHKFHCRYYRREHHNIITITRTTTNTHTQHNIKLFILTCIFYSNTNNSIQ